MKRSALSLFSLLLVISLAIVSGCATKPNTNAPTGGAGTPASADKPEPTPAPKAPTKIRVGYNKTWDVSPLIIGNAKGYWNDNGNIQVEMIEITDPVKGIQALVSGDLDVAAVTVTNLMAAQEQKLPVVAVAALNGLSDPPQDALLASTNIKSIQDLKGKTIGINNYGGAFDLHLYALLETNGLDAKNDATIVIIPIPAVIESIVQGKLDAGMVPPIFVSIAQAQFADKVHVLAGNDDTPGIKELDNYQTMVIAMSPKWIEQNREAATSFLSGYLDAVEFINEQPKDALNMWAEAAGSTIIASWNTPPKLPADGRSTSRDCSLILIS